GRRRTAARAAARPAVRALPQAVPAGPGLHDRALRHPLAGLLRGPHRLHRPDRTHRDDPARRVQPGGAGPGDRRRGALGARGDPGRRHRHGLRTRTALRPGAVAPRRARHHRGPARGHRLQHLPGQRRRPDRQPGRARQPAGRRAEVRPARARGERRDHHGRPGSRLRRPAGPAPPPADAVDAPLGGRHAATAEGRRTPARARGGDPVNVLTFVDAFFSDAAHWHGYDGIPRRLLEHLQYTLLALSVAAAIGLPAGLLTGHTGRGGNAVAFVANAARALPSFGLLVLVVLLIGFGLLPVMIPLVVLAVPPI